MANEFSVEFAHIYTDERLNNEHFEAVKMLINLESKRLKSANGYSTCLLIDDYNPSENLLDINKFLASVEAMGVQIDFFAMESDLVPAATATMELLTEKKKKAVKGIIARTGKLPCSILTATWYLMRLGFVNGDKVVRKHSESPNGFTGSKLINILPQRFEAAENRTYSLMLELETSFKPYERIEYVYF